MSENDAGACLEDGLSLHDSILGLFPGGVIEECRQALSKNPRGGVLASVLGGLSATERLRFDAHNRAKAAEYTLRRETALAWRKLSSGRYMLAGYNTISNRIEAVHESLLVLLKPDYKKNILQPAAPTSGLPTFAAVRVFDDHKKFSQYISVAASRIRTSVENIGLRELLIIVLIDDPHDRDEKFTRANLEKKFPGHGYSPGHVKGVLHGLRGEAQQEGSSYRVLFTDKGLGRGDITGPGRKVGSKNER